MTTAGLYLRVSTCSQTTENQRRELEAACEQRGWKLGEEFSDNGISGAKDRSMRPGFDALWQAVAAQKIDVVAVWAIDRLARSLSQLVAFMDELRKHNVGLYVHTQGIDTTTPAGRAMYQMVGVFAEFEREMIRSRVMAGLERAKAEGKKLGAPKSPRESEIRELVRHGYSIRDIRKMTGVGHSMIVRIRGEETK